MATLQLPTFAANRDHRYNVVLDGETFTVEFHFNARAARWTVHWFDVTETPIRHGVRLVIADDLLKRVALASKPAGSVNVVDTTGTDTEPDGDTLGAQVRLRYAEA